MDAEQIRQTILTAKDNFGVKCAEFAGGGRVGE